LNLISGKKNNSEFDEELMSLGCKITELSCSLAIAKSSGIKRLGSGKEKYLTSSLPSKD
jgi:hypothetical protein